MRIIDKTGIQSGPANTIRTNDHLKKWDKFCKELRDYAAYELHEASVPYNKNPEDLFAKTWYDFAKDQKVQLEGKLKAFDTEIRNLHDFDDSVSEREIASVTDRLNEIMLLLSTLYNPETMNFRNGGIATDAAAANVAVATAADTRGDVAGGKQKMLTF